MKSWHIVKIDPLDIAPEIDYHEGERVDFDSSDPGPDFEFGSEFEFGPEAESLSASRKDP